MRRSIVLFLLVAACSTGGSGDPRSACELVRDHSIQLRAKGMPEDIAERHEENLADTLGRELVTECEQRGPSYAECALTATDMDALRRCP
jgi:hypothetical protein